MIHFTKHAEEKFAILRRYGFRISRRQVVDALTSPDIIDYSRLPLCIAQKRLDQTHVLRVVYKREGDRWIVITFYPGRITQYGKSE